MPVELRRLRERDIICVSLPIAPRRRVDANNTERRRAMYETPEIIYEGELEVQAGSPLGLPEWDDMLDGEW